MNIKLKQNDAVSHTAFYKKHDEDFAYDLTATEYTINKTDYGTYMVTYNTSINTEFPILYGVKIAPRSSIYKTRLRLVNAEAIIDSTYRGEWKINFDIVGTLTKKDKEKLDKGELLKYMYKPGDRIAQCYVLRKENINVQLVKELSKTNRGEGGFGSTNKKEKDNGKENISK